MLAESLVGSIRREFQDPKAPRVSFAALQTEAKPDPIEIYDAFRRSIAEGNFDLAIAIEVVSRSEFASLALPAIEECALSAAMVSARNGDDATALAYLKFASLINSRSSVAKRNEREKGTPRFPED